MPYKFSDKAMEELDLDVNELLSNLVKLTNAILDDEDEDFRAAAYAFSMDFRSLDHYIRNLGKMPNDWRNNGNSQL